VGTAGLVLALVIFMLLERRDLRDRLIGVFGYADIDNRPLPELVDQCNDSSGWNINDNGSAFCPCLHLRGRRW
jgi:hypothetical protein